MRLAIIALGLTLFIACGGDAADSVARTQAKSIDGDVGKLQERIAALEAQMETLQAGKQAESASVDAMIAEVALARADVDEALLGLTELETTAFNLSVALATADGTLSSLTARTDSLDSRVYAASATLGAHDNALTGLNGDLSSLETNVDAAHNGFATDIGTLSANTTNLQGQTDGLTSGLSTLRTEFDELEYALYQGAFSGVTVGGDGSGSALTAYAVSATGWVMGPVVARYTETVSSDEYEVVSFYSKATDLIFTFETGSAKFREFGVGSTWLNTGTGTYYSDADCTTPLPASTYYYYNPRWGNDFAADIVMDYDVVTGLKVMESHGIEIYNSACTQYDFKGFRQRTYAWEPTMSTLPAMPYRVELRPHDPALDP